MPRMTIGRWMIVVAASAVLLSLAPWVVLPLLSIWPFPLGLVASGIAWTGTRDHPERRPGYLVLGLMGGVAIAHAAGPVAALVGWGIPLVLTLALRSVLTDDRAAWSGRGMPRDELLVYTLAGACVFGVPVLSMVYLVVNLP